MAGIFLVYEEGLLDEMAFVLKVFLDVISIVPLSHSTGEHDVYFGANGETLFSSGCVTHLYRIKKISWFILCVLTPFQELRLLRRQLTSC
jgi:hypothetical protein